MNQGNQEPRTKGQNYGTPIELRDRLLVFT